MGLLGMLGLTPRNIIGGIVGKAFGSIGLPNPMSLMGGGGGGGGGMSAPQAKPVDPTIQQNSNMPPLVANNPEGQMQQPMQMNPQQTAQQVLQYLFPTKQNQITSGFGNRQAPMPGASTFHQGVDIGNPAGTPINAFTSGKVIDVGQNNGLGNFMKMLGDDNRTYTYGHAQNFGVKPGQQVTAGQQVGAVGSTGISTAPHLHFMASEQGKYIDPASLFKKYLGY